MKMDAGNDQRYVLVRKNTENVMAIAYAMNNDVWVVRQLTR